MLKRRSQKPAVAAEIQLLEPRALLSHLSILSGMYANPDVESTVNVTPAVVPGGFSPDQMKTAYGFNQVANLTSPAGTGQTIAIVDAFNDPNIQADLQAFDAFFGIANPPSLRVMNQNGTATLPGTDPAKTWELEESLDVEWAHALAPGANIVLVEANSSSFSDLFTAVQTAANLPGVSVVSMSWGGAEFSFESAYDSIFTTPSGHSGITFVGSTGDSGSPSGFPAYSPNVLAVGGTTLTVGTSGSYVSESGWAGSGGGISLYESQPAYQSGVVTQSTTKRTNPDVSFDANPGSGVSVYDSFSSTTAPWITVGGTSLSAPSWASIISIVDQARVQNGLTPLDGASQTLPMLYQLDKTDPAAFHDVTTGSNGFSAGIGYDLVTGLGSPVVNLLTADLSGTPAPLPAAKLAFQQLPTSGIVGQALNSFSVAVENQNGQVVAGDASLVTLTVSSGSFDPRSTIAVRAVNGIATFSNVILNAVGSYSLTAADGILTAAASGSIVINPVPAAQLAFRIVPTTIVAGSFSFSVTVAMNDLTGQRVFTDRSSITIGILSGPGVFLPNVTTTSNGNVNGLANFGIAFTLPGVYTLIATDGTMQAGISNQIIVTAAPAIKLVIQSLPATGRAEQAYGPVVVQIQNQLNQVVTSDNSFVTLTIFGGPGPFDSQSTVTVQAVNGVATFSNLYFTVAGYYKLKAADGSLSYAVSSILTIGN